MFFLIAAVGSALGLSGCRQDAIETYRVARPEPPAPAASRVRLLGAIAVHGDSTWFFKLVGPLEAVAAQKGAFDEFIHSVRFQDKADEPVTWKKPAGWEQLPGQGFRHATLRIGGGEKPLELVVSRLGREGEASSILANVNRWRKNDLGLKPLRAAELSKAVREEKVEGVAFTLIDMDGPGGEGGGGMMPPFAGGGPAAPPGKPAAPEKLAYETPAGWEPFVSERMGIRAEAAFRVREGETVAVVTVTSLGGTGGGLVANVNRWRADQLGMPAWSEKEVRENVVTLPVGGAEASYVDMAGVPPGAKKPERILAVIVPRGDKTYFVKMQGPADLVGKQKGAFEKFIGSLKFEGGNRG